MCIRDSFFWSVVMSLHAVFFGAAGSAEGAGADADGAAGADADGAGGASTGAGAALGGVGGAASASGCVPPQAVRTKPNESASAEVRNVVMGEEPPGREDAL